MRFSSFILRWLRPPRKIPDMHVVVFTRAGCHLCDDAWTLLQQYQARHNFQLEARDVDTEPALRAQYGDCVPVVTFDGKVRFRGRVNPVLLERLLASQ